MAKIGPYSRHAALAKVDGRTREARLVRSLRAELTAHVGGSPTTTQRLLIDQACQLQLRIVMMDKLPEIGEMSERRQVQYLAWTGSLSRLLRQLDDSNSTRPSPYRRGADDHPTAVPRHPDTHPSFGRTRAGRQLRETIAQLVQHVGGRPDAIQARLIDTAAQLELRIGEMDQRFQQTGQTDESYSTLVGQYARALRDLGIPR